MTDVIVERQLDFFGASGSVPGAVKLHLPEPDDRAWRCEYDISWPGYEHSSRALGEDSWQALMLAMEIVPTLISVTDDFKAGRIGVWGEKLTSYAEINQAFGFRGEEFGFRSKGDEQ